MYICIYEFVMRICICTSISLLCFLNLYSCIFQYFNRERIIFEKFVFYPNFFFQKLFILRSNKKSKIRITALNSLSSFPPKKTIRENGQKKNCKKTANFFCPTLIFFVGKEDCRNGL